MSHACEDGVRRRLSQGYAALRSGACDRAATAFNAALSSGGDAAAEVHEGLGWVAFYRDDPETASECWEKAYTAYRDDGQSAGAARMATWLATTTLELRGQEALAEGWLARADRLLDHTTASPELAWLALQRTELALEGGDPAAARPVGRDVADIARRLGHDDLELLGSAVEGLGLVLEGRVQEGMRRLDEAAVAAVAGELREPLCVGWACCHVLHACEAVHDQRQTSVATEAAELARHNAPPLFRRCRCHYAGVLMDCGAWNEAEAELEGPIDQRTTSRPGQAAKAVARLGELRRRQGRDDDAARLFAEAEGHPIALIGEGSMALDGGEPATAAAVLERALRRIPLGNRIARAEPLALLVEARLALGEGTGAAATAGQLADLAALSGTAHMRATAACGAGLLCQAQGRHGDARRAFEDAVDLFREARSPYQCLRARVDLSRVLQALGELRAAEREAASAATEADRLGARGVSSDAHSVLQAVSTSGNSVGPLTPREQEILTLVAEGLSDGAISARMFISHHTVHRHVANIRTKLGVASRAAAVAQARRLVDNVPDNEHHESQP